jgi:hypothetical protein
MLEDAGPAVSARSAELEAELEALILTTETCAAKRRPSLGVRLGIAAGTALGVVGVAGVANAAGIGPSFEWVPWHTESGTSCQFRTQATPDGLLPTSERDAPSERETRRAVAAAAAYLRTFDYDSIDVAEAIRQYEVLPDQPDFTGDQLELTAVNSYVAGVVNDYLEQQGLNPTAVLYATETRCDQ